VDSRQPAAQSAYADSADAGDPELAARKIIRLPVHME
jgi:hypothetical protein